MIVTEDDRFSGSYKLIFRTFINFQILVLVLLISYSASAKFQCEHLLNPVRQDIIKPLLSATQNLNLPSGLNRQESKFKANVHEELFNSLSFFRPSLENLSGGVDLFKIFEDMDELSNRQIKDSLNEWASEFLPGYEILFLDDIKSFKFRNSYPNKSVKIFDEETGTLDDKFLIELYANKKIPILNTTDLISKLLVLAIPKLREQFEKLVDLYQRGQALGDLNEDDLMYTIQRNKRPYANNDRLSYISSIIELLTSRLVFLSPYAEERQLVLFGANNLLSASLDLNSVNLSKSLDLSLKDKKRALDYFIQKALENSKSVLGLFNFLVKNNLLPKPAKDHMAFPAVAHQSIFDQVVHFDFVRLEARIVSDRQNDNEEQAWIRYSNFVYHDRSNPVAQVARYQFRFAWIEHYIKIVEGDIVSAENRSNKEQPGPLFR